MKKLYKLFRLHCQDLLVLQEMEYNGMLFNVNKARTRAKELEEKSNEIVREFNSLLNTDSVNIGSGVHISAILYGGTIIEEFRVPVGHYKTGAKKGEVRYKIEKIEHTFPRLVEPIKGSETAKSKKAIGEEATEWSVKEEVLKSLKAKGNNKRVLDLILEYRKVNKLRSTYLEGISDLITEMNWENNIIHGQLNQCVAVTGRLSSSKPNQQNLDKETKKYFESRYDNTG